MRWRSVRILHLITDLSGGGAERQLSYLAPGLARRGHEVHLGYSRGGDFPPPLPGVELTRFHTRSNYDPRLFSEIARLLERVQPDVMQTWILQMDIVGGAVASMKGVPWILREPSSAKAYRPLTWKVWLRTQMARQATAIACNSRGGEEYWRHILPDTPRHIVPNGVPLAEIDQTSAATPKGMLAGDVPIVLYVGRLSSDRSATKNLVELVEAIAVVKGEVDVTAVLCGEGPQKEELMALRARLGLERDVSFTGQVPAAAVWGLMKAAAVFVSLSAYEGFPNTVMEAMACRCPVVLSDIAAHRELVDETSAVFVDPHDRRATADAIIRVLHDPESAKRRAASARAKVEQWSTASMVERFERIYEGMR